MKKVYVVTQGEYSDFSPMAIFSTKEKAVTYRDIIKKKVKDRWNKPNETIEEYILDIPKTKATKIFVRMNKEGDTIDAIVEPNVGEELLTRFDSEGNLMSEVATSSVTRAIKVVNERRIQILASSQWNKRTK